MGEYLCSDGTTWESYEDYALNQFGYMGYDDDTKTLVLKLLRELYFGNDPLGGGHFFIRKSDGYEWAFQALLLEILASNNLLEYGISPRGGWLTEEGRKLFTPIFEAQRG